MARIAAVGAMSFCRFSSGVSSLVEAFVTPYSQTLPSRRSTRYGSPSLSWQKSGEIATEPSGNASIVIRISSPSRRRVSSSSPPAIAGWSGGSSSGPQSAQITKVTGKAPPRRLRPRASSVRLAVASLPRALAATTRAAGLPKTARNNPLTRSVAEVVTVFSASRSSANRSAATYVYMVSPVKLPSRTMASYLRSSSVSEPDDRARAVASAREKIFSCHATTRSKCGNSDSGTGGRSAGAAAADSVTGPAVEGTAGAVGGAP